MHAALEAVVEMSLATAARKDLGLDDLLGRGCRQEGEKEGVCESLFKTRAKGMCVSEEHTEFGSHARGLLAAKGTLTSGGSDAIFPHDVDAVH